MSDKPKVYVAGVGMITPVGANAKMTAAGVKAGINSYAETDYTSDMGLPITMASVPDLILDELDAEIGEGDRYDARHFRVLKMAIIAIREACAQLSTQQPIPLMMAMPEVLPDADDEADLVPINQTLEDNCKPWISAKQYRSFHSGRAAGMEAIDFVFRYLVDIPNDFVLIGGSDSYRDDARLMPLCEVGRVMVSRNQNSFAPGEAAAFLLLTRHPDKAMVRNGNIIALHRPGMADEPGHMGSDEPYRGDGLDQAFKQAIGYAGQNNIHSIYSIMNGENFWTKEYGVAYMRNQAAFQHPVSVEHPADCYGDLGSATSSTLIALAAEDLWTNTTAQSHLVYSSSDTSKRGAVVLEKVTYPASTVSNKFHDKTEVV